MTFRIIKIIPLLFFLALLVPGQTVAQDQEGHRMEKRRGAKHLDKMKTDLSLTDDQYAAIEEIFKTHRAEMKSLRSAETKDKEAQRALKTEMENAILEVLDDEQDALFLKHKEERKAQRDERQGMRKANREQWKLAKQEIKAYRQKNITPLLMSKRSDFEEKISTEDKLEIDALRKEIKTIKENRRAAFKGEGKDNPTPLKGHRFEKQGNADGAKAHRHRSGKAGNGRVFKEHPELKEKALGLVDKFEVELNEVEAELAAPREQWKAGQRAILEKHFDEEMMTKLAERKKGKEEERRKFSKIGFLLMQPDGHDGKLRKGTPEENAHQLKAYPNPATNQQTLEFVVAQKGMVSIDLIDNNGKVVQQLYHAKLAAGPQSISVEISNLSGNYYYYLISDQTGQSTLPMVIAQ